MSTVIINDEELTIEPGEVLLDVARRNASHIGFVCDGNGLCQMCECLVLKGAEQLSPPSYEEKVWLTEEQLAEGRRLCCQASVRGPGPVEVLTRAEELRRQADNIFNPPAGTNIFGNAVRFIQSLIKINVEHVRKFPGNTIYAMSNFLRARATLETELRVLNDSWRITSRLLTGKKSSFPLLDDQGKPVALLPFSTQMGEVGVSEAPPVSITPKVVLPEPPKSEPKPVPVAEAPKPVPVAEAPKPVPVAEAPKPVPVAEAPKPVPVAEAPKPVPVVEAPKLVASGAETVPTVAAPKPAGGVAPQQAEKEKPAPAAPKSTPAAEKPAATSGTAGASPGTKPAASASTSQGASSSETGGPSVTTASSGSKPAVQATSSTAPSNRPAEDKSSPSFQKTGPTSGAKIGSKRKPSRRK